LRAKEEQIEGLDKGGYCPWRLETLAMKVAEAR
jgi:hypothetical protein